MPAAPGPFSIPWWEQEDKLTLGKTLSGLVGQLWEEDTSRRSDIEENYRRFSGSSQRGGVGVSIPSPEVLALRKRPLRLNVVKSVVETITAKVGKNRPRPTLLTDGAQHELQTKVRDLQKFVDGAYQQAEVYQKVPIVFRDAMIAGTGILYFYGMRQADSGRICAERVFPTEMLVDARDALHGEPMAIHRVKHVDRFVAGRLFPKSKAAIMDAPGVGFDDVPDYERGAVQHGCDLVRLTASWYRASYAHDGTKVEGRHVIVAGNTVVHDEPWEADHFPFELFHWTSPTQGMWGEPAVNEVIPIDGEINTLLQQIQQAMKLTANPWVMVAKGSKVKAGKLTNKTGQIVEYDGAQPPQVVSFQPIHPQVIQHLWGLYAKAYEILGSNEMAASAVKPPGVDSGRALEQLSEEHLVRFETQSRHLEDVVGVRSCRQVLRVAKELDATIPGGFVLRSVADKSTMLRLPWSKVEMSPLDFFVQCWPTSILPATPAGRTEEVERWQNNQWITPQRAQKLLDFPDLTAESNITLANDDLLDSQISQMLYGESDEPVLPDPRQDLETAATRATFALLRGIEKNVPEARLRLVRRYLDAIDEINEAAAPPPPPEAVLPPEAGGMGPEAAMGAPPAPGMPPMGMPPGPMPMA